MKDFFIKIIGAYRKYASPLLGKNCRFYPSCSEYAVLAIRKFGAINGGKKALVRILKCNQWHQGGIDLP
ncbi:MAG: membrane protein insertion efficiency factor YidD [Candidatus Wildermuthbacteria bacterium]|nr:membrane protein insertion efficiency factor YidD [Candidatus Wildermuthbacteria bacterium]